MVFQNLQDQLVLTVLIILDEVDLENEKNKKQLDMAFGMDNACEGMCGV
jgi:hypothetical protein